MIKFLLLLDNDCGSPGQIPVFTEVLRIFKCADKMGAGAAKAAAELTPPTGD